MALPLDTRGLDAQRRVQLGAAGETLDPRALENGREIAAHLTSGEDTCVMLTGPSHTGKTQSAMAAKRALDPGGEQSLHTSAAILCTNAAIAPADRSATWESWTAILARFPSGTAPKLVVIDEAGSRGPPDAPFTLEEAKAKRLLADWRAQGTKFIVIGHDPNDKLSGWAEWLSGARSHYAALDTRG